MQSYFLSVAILAQSFQLADSGADSARPHRLLLRAFGSVFFAMPGKGSPYNGKGEVPTTARGTGSRLAAANAEIAEAWAAGATLAELLATAEAALATAKAATAAQTDAARWKRMHDELVNAAGWPSLKRR